MLDKSPKLVAILQSSYIPWKGYFDIIDQVDEFIIYDDVQFTKRDWRSRNKIKTANGLAWLTVPVKIKGKYSQLISDVEVADHNWSEKHWQTIRHAYSKAPYFKKYSTLFEGFYKQCGEIEKLTEVNFLFISAICDVLQIKTKITFSQDYGKTDLSKTARLVALCQAAKATHYLSGPSAKAYIKAEQFSQVGVALEYMSYDKYSAYPQLFGEFQHEVSVLDLIFNIGDSAVQYLKSSSE